MSVRYPTRIVPAEAGNSVADFDSGLLTLFISSLAPEDLSSVPSEKIDFGNPALAIRRSQRCAGHGVKAGTSLTRAGD